MISKSRGGVKPRPRKPPLDFPQQEGLGGFRNDGIGDAI